MYFELAEGIIDKSVSQLVIEKKENVVAFTITNIGDVDFKYAAGIIIEPNSSKTVGGSTLVPFNISKVVGFVNPTDESNCQVIIEKVILIKEEGE
jgi:hypothetical protein